MVFEFVRACAWHLAWHVCVTLLVVHVHARIYARMRIRASCACPNDVAVTASYMPESLGCARKFTLTYPHISSLYRKPATGDPQKRKF
jgi:hypothetical protein